VPDPRFDWLVSGRLCYWAGCSGGRQRSWQGPKVLGRQQGYAATFQLWSWQATSRRRQPLDLKATWIEGWHSEEFHPMLAAGASAAWSHSGEPLPPHSPCPPPVAQVEKVQPKQSFPAYLEVVDIAGLVKGAAEVGGCTCRRLPARAWRWLLGCNGVPGSACPGGAACIGFHGKQRLWHTGQASLWPPCMWPLRP
jgi:hypothetical protein